MSDVESVASSAASPAMAPSAYAPSPNTTSAALNRANQLRVQALLRQLLTQVHATTAAGNDNDKRHTRELDDRRRIDTLRVLRKTLRELGYQLSWLTQVDFLETMERILRDEDSSAGCDWRLINDSIQLLIEIWPRFLHEIDQQTIEQIVPSIVQNLGHERSEVRRASLLFLNMLINEKNSPSSMDAKKSRRRPNQFRLIMRMFIDYGLANYRHEQAQRGSILSLPLLINEQTIEGEDLLPLIRCLSDLLVDSNEQLFYSLYLALQRLHLMLGDDKFQYYLRQCEPEAYLLYRQAASRSNSLSVNTPGGSGQHTRRRSSDNKHQSHPSESGGGAGSGGESTQQQQSGEQQNKQVTFEIDEQRRQREQAAAADQSTPGDAKDVAEEADSAAAVDGSRQSADSMETPVANDDDDSAASGRQSEDRQQQQQQVNNTHQRSAASSISSSSPASSILNDDGLETSLFTNEQRDLMNEPSPNSSSSSSSVSASTRANNKTNGPMASSRPPASPSVSSTCSSDAHLVDPIHYMNAAALHGKPLKDYERIHHVDHSNISSLAINDLGPVCNTPTMEFGGPVGYGGQSELKFGIFQRHLVLAALSSPSYGGRLEAMQEMMCIIRESPINHLAILMTYFDEFLEQFLAKLMHQGQDYKLELIAIDMIETIVIKTKVSTMRYVRPLVNLLIKTLADSRAIFKDNSVRVIHKMMAYLPPQHVIDAIFEHKHNKSPLVREESINRVTAAVLEYDKNEFNLTKLCFHVLPMLADPQPSVRLAALECIAALANALGPERIGSLLTAAEAVQTGCDYDGLLDAINARLMRHTLPRCNQDGSIRYVIKAFLSPTSVGQHLEQEAADVRWVLEAPSSHQHAGAGPYYHPHQPHHYQQPVAEHAHHPHHRLGVYSPPDLQSRRRRSSLGGLLAAAAHHHHHHHQFDGDGADRHAHHHADHHHHHHQQHGHNDSNQQQQQQQEEAPDRQKSEQPTAAIKSSRSTDDQNHDDDDDGGGDGDTSHQQHHRRRCRRDSCKEAVCGGGGATDEAAAKSATTGGQPTEGASSSKRSSTLSERIPSNEQQPPRDCSKTSNGSRRSSQVKTSRDRYQQDHSNSRSISSVRRSDSQDSLSSTDTNKMLFQYYLGKFKQSLSDSSGQQRAAVLPSDSIIYTDIGLAYDLSRHQSRQQQTSFDYDPHSVGRVQGKPLTSNSSQVAPTATRSDAKADVQPETSQESRRSNAGQSPPINEPPPADRCPSGASSGSESPQTVMEASNGRHGSRRQSSQHDRSVGRKSSASDQSQQQVADSHQSRRQSVSNTGQEDRQQQQQQQQRRKSVLSSPGPEAAAVDIDSQEQHQQGQEEANENKTPKRRNLVRQSASESSQQYQQKQQQQQQQQPPQPSRHRSQASLASRGEPPVASKSPVISRQESNTTTVSESNGSQQSEPTSQRASGDSSGGRPDGQPDGHHTRRHRSSRRRSSSRKRKQSADIGGNDLEDLKQQQQPVDNDDDDIDDSERRERRRRASRSQPPPTSRRQQQQQQQPQVAARPASRSHEQEHEPSNNNNNNLMKAQSATGNIDLRRACSVSPSLASSLNIRHILENVAEVEGPFPDPQLALKVAMDALDSPCWSTKVEGLLALVRLATYHDQVIVGHLHEIVCKTVDETRNLRSTVSRSAIFALGDYCCKLKRLIEPEADIMVQALLQKSTENTAFIRDDIRKTLGLLVDNVTHWRLANSLINHGANHKSMHVRRMTSQFVALLVDRMGAAKCLVGAKDISAQVIPAAAKFAQDSSPHTRYYGRLILSKLMQHGAFERLMRRNLTPNLYRSSLGIVESVRRRGPGEPPADS